LRWNDAFLLPIAALWQQKLRTILTTLGVIFGAFVLAASLSIGEGVQETIDRESRRNEISRRVDVSSKWDTPKSKSAEDEVKVEGTMTSERRDRLRKSLADSMARDSPAKTVTNLTRDRLKKLAAIPHVDRVIPRILAQGFVLLNGKSESATVSSARPDDEAFRKRVVAGSYLVTPNQKGVVITEFLAYRLGLINDADIEAAIGKPIRIEFRTQPVEPGLRVYLRKSQGQMSLEESNAVDKVADHLPEALDKLGLSPAEAQLLRESLKGQPASRPQSFTLSFTLLGVIRRATDDERNRSYEPDFGDSMILVPYQTATDLMFLMPSKEELYVDQAVLLVDKEENVKAVVKQVEDLGLSSRAAIEFIERERLIYLLIFGGMTCVAGVALLVSALGIANTMLMSVLERTREIGIMKAVGADNRHLQFMFLVEGALIGLFGAVIGLALAWLASIPGDAWVRSMVMRDIKIELKGSIFVFPPWISISVLIFTVLVTTFAALYPARHASRIDPVKALRHE
jgi:putative ABC transport system permease protein